MFDGLKTRKRLIELEEQMLKLTRIVEAHDLEWDDMRARCKRLLDRTEKAAKRVESEVQSEEPQDLQTEGEGQGSHLTLSPAQQRLNLQILRQRQRKIS